jgi:hypothetical protein
MRAICTDSNLNVSDICEKNLTSYCSTVKDRQKVFDNLNYGQLCGCHLDPSVYITSPQDPSGLCDPICNIPNTVKKDNQVCNLDICIFDGTVINSIIDGKINVAEICGSGTNRCYYSKDFINTIQQNPNINFSNNCSECFSYDTASKNLNQNITKIDCFGTPITPSGLPTGAIVAIGVSVAVIIIGVLIFFLI